MTREQVQWLSQIQKSGNRSNNEVFKLIWKAEKNPNECEFFQKAYAILLDRGKADEYEEFKSQRSVETSDNLVRDDEQTIVFDLRKTKKSHNSFLSDFTISIPVSGEPEFEKDNRGNLYQTIYNAEQAITYDSQLRGKIFFNELSYSPYTFGGLPWKSQTNLREWVSSDDNNLLSYIEHNYSLRCAEKVRTGLDNVIHKYTVNPVKIMLKSLHNMWDQQTGHIDRLLPDMLGAEDTDYTRAVMHLFMQGAISRIYHKGCQFDYMLVLVGDQGAGKSTFIRLLAIYDDWFSDSLNILDGDKPFEKIRGMWIVEMPELQAIKRTKDVESVKAFITSRSDYYREPYARRAEQKPRMCVLAGTTNSYSFLTDRTGNRRFLPVRVSVHKPKFNIFDDEAATRAEIRQAWGEAMAEFKDANEEPVLVLPKELLQEAERQQETFSEEDTAVGIIQEWLDKTSRDRVCVLHIWNECLKEDRRPTAKESSEIHEILRNSIKGWTYSGKQRTDEYGIQRCYSRQQNIVDEVEATEIPF